MDVDQAVACEYAGVGDVGVPVLGSLPDRVWVRYRDRRSIQRRLRISLVDRCNLACFFCHNEGQGPITRSSQTRLSSAEVVALARIAARAGVDDIKLTGGEPMLYRSHDGDIVDIVREISDLRVTGEKFDLSMTTNGTMLSEFAVPLAMAGLDRVTVSLTTMDWRTFGELVSPNTSLMRRTVRGIAEAWAAGLRPTKINVPVYYSTRRQLGNLYELPDLVSFAADNNVAEVRVFTLLSHQDFPDFPEYYHFFSREMMNSVTGCLMRFGVDAVAETVATLAELGRAFSSYAYPKVEFGVDLGPTVLAFEPMRHSRLDHSVSGQEGPYAIRVGADGGIRTVLGDKPDHALIDALRSGASDDVLTAAYLAVQKEMP